MSRTIKFRAWDIEKKDWYKPVHEAYKQNLFELFIRFSGELSAHTMRGLEHESMFANKFELTQFIGLLDKKGNEIYEGDIVETYAVWEDGKYEYHPVEFEFGAFTIDHTSAIDGGMWWDDCEIVGNIYQNQELLKNQDGK